MPESRELETRCQLPELWTINQGCTDAVTGTKPLLDAVKSAFLQFRLRPS